MKLKKTEPGMGTATAFTLVEVVFAVLVLSTIGLAYYGALSSSFSVVQATREDLRATQILVQKTEAIRLCTWGQLTNFSFREPYDPRASNQTSGAMFYGTVITNSATNIPNSCSYSSKMCLVTVSVSWTNFGGRAPQAHTRQMQTQVARFGMQNYVWGAQ